NSLAIITSNPNPRSMIKSEFICYWFSNLAPNAKAETNRTRFFVDRSWIWTAHCCFWEIKLTSNIAGLVSPEFIVFAFFVHQAEWNAFKTESRDGDAKFTGF